MRTALAVGLAVATLGAASAQPAPPDTLRAPAALVDSLQTFGWSVAADDATLLVGADERRDLAALGLYGQMGNPKGTVFVYRLTDSGPVLDGRLVSDRVENQDCFSWSLDVRGDVAAVGASCEYDPDGFGAIYLYRRGADGWRREAKLRPADLPEPHRAPYEFGATFALGDDLLVVRAPFDNSATLPGDAGSGAVVVFERQGGAWVQTDVIVNADADALLNESFGRSLALSGPRGGEILFAGALAAGSPGAAPQGSVYVFEREGGQWVQRARLTCDSPGNYDPCGSLIDAGPSGEAVVGSSRVARPLDRVGDDWVLGEPLDAAGNFAAFGLARHGNEIASLGLRYSGVGASRLHVFHRDGTGWTADSLAHPNISPYGGPFVALNATHRFVGQSVSGNNVTNDAVLIYRRDGTVATEPTPASRALALRLAPNPTAGLATVFVSLPSATTLRTEVVDVQGRVVWRADETAAAGEHAVALDLGGVAAGVYVVRVTAGRETGQTTVVRR